MISEVQIDGRPTWDAYYLMLANTVSLRADCRRREVGAVLVLSDNHSVYIGYNGTIPGEDGCLLGACPRGLKSYEETPPYSDYSDCIGVHAEDNALRSFDESDRDSSLLHGSTMYITDRPCSDCQDLLRVYGVARAVFPGANDSIEHLELTPRL